MSHEGRIGSAPRGRTVVALVRDHDAVHRIRAALGGVATLVPFADREHFLTYLRRHPVAAVLVEPWDAQGRPAAPAVEMVRAEHAGVVVLAYCRLDARDCREMAAVARAGAHGVLFRGVDDVGAALRSAFARGEETLHFSEVLDTIAAAAPQVPRDALAYCLENASRPITIVELARAIGVNRKTLLNRFARADVPPPSTIVSWCRLLHAARELEDPARTVDDVATRSGFGSGAALRKMFRRYTGRRPAQVRKAGGARWVLQRFARVCAARDAVGRSA